MRQKNISSVDVARRAGVSRTTVSFVLNNTPGKSISEETRRKVLKAAEELQYVPNEYARQLAMVRHMSVGLFVCHTHSVFSDAYIIRLIEGMSQSLNRSRFQLTIVPVRLDESDYIEIARRNGVDGVILINTHEQDPGIPELEKAEFPLVVIGSAASDDVYRVDIDNRVAARKTVEYLVSMGHSDIGMITHALPVYSAAVERLAGFRDALAAAGLPVREDWIRNGDFTEQSGYRAMQEILALSGRPTAVYAARDTIAYGAINAVRDAGLSVPDDISIIGFDDDFLSRYLNPPLTTMSLPAASIGAQAAELMIARLSSGTLPAKRRILLPTHLSRRCSVRKLS